jgi:broad specificity phosphatase PhoE
MEQPTTVRFPGGESFADLRERALASLQAIRHAHRCAVVVTHGGVIRAALGEWLSMPDDAVFRLAQDYCGVSIVDWFEDTPLVRVVNAAGIASLSDGAAAPSMTD